MSGELSSARFEEGQEDKLLLSDNSPRVETEEISGPPVNTARNGMEAGKSWLNINVNYAGQPS
jgi:hypothetical protein